MIHRPDPNHTVKSDYTLHCEDCGEDYNAPFCPGYASEHLLDDVYLYKLHATLDTWNRMGSEVAPHYDSVLEAIWDGGEVR